MNQTHENGTLTVTQTYKKGQVVTNEDRDDTDIEIKPFVTDTARVSFTQQHTLNMGNYESVKIGITCTLPTYIEEIPEALTTSERIVNDELGRLVGELCEYRESRKKATK